MSAFDRARFEANSLRQRLLLGCPKAQPTSLELLSFVEDELALAIERVPADYPALGGGAAVLDRIESYIYVRNDVTEDEFSYLVAHELGHWILDADRPQTTIAHLKSIAAAPETPAIAKVEAYGARERQELQANVFARELLLPRDTARALWHSGFGVYQIAKHQILPTEIVRLQLLDGILLPQHAPHIAKILPVPSADQVTAATAKERFVNVVAGPGTGKTTTLVHRVQHLIKDLGVEPTRILVLTFANKAASELVERLKNIGISRADEIWAGTFHAFGLEFLRKYHQHFQIDPNVLIADKLQQISLLVKNLSRVELTHYLRIEDPYDWLRSVIKCIHRLKEELVSPSEYKTRIQAIDESDESLRRQREDIASLYELHESLLAEARMVDFVDLVAKPAMMIKNARASVSELADHFEHILVDEYQDVTEAMVALTRQLATNAKSLWVVGDVRQAIHHWRGASVKSLMKFENAFKTPGSSSTVKKYSLDANRRSSTEILNLISEAGRVHVLQRTLPLDTMHALNGPTGVMPELVECDSRLAVASAIAIEINKNRVEGIRFQEQAILCRKKADVEFISTHMQAAGIPLLYIGELVNRVEIKRLLCLMQILCERAPRALVGLSDIARIAMSMSDISLLLRESIGKIEWQRGRWLGEGPAGISADGVQASKTLKALLAGFSRHSNPWKFVCDMVLDRRFGLPDDNDTSLEAQTQRLAIWQFAYSVRNGDGDMRQATLSRYLLRQQLRQRIDDTYGDRELPPEALSLDAVRLMTVHGSKGLEFRATHIGYIDDDSYGANAPTWDVDDSIVPLVPPHVLGSSATEHAFETAVERNNLFYVALSRARERLQIYENLEFSSKVRLRQLANNPRNYIKKSVKNQAPKIAMGNGATVPTKNLTVKLDEFEAYIRCPLQHHYRFGLQLSHEREIDMVLRARWVISETLEEYARNKTAPKQVFGDAWERYELPNEEADPQFITDAKKVCRRGLTRIAELNGSFIEKNISKLGGLSVELPWLLETRTRSESRLHLIRFSSRGVSSTISYLRPLIGEISGRRPTPMEVHTLLEEKTFEVKISQRPESTTAYKAAGKMCANQIIPAPGRQCAKCAYITICPTRAQ